MKKKVLALSSVLLSAVAVFGATGCATKNTSKLIPEGGISYSSKTTELNTLGYTNDDFNRTSYAVDDTGLALVTKRFTSYGAASTSTTYSLVDMKNQQEVTGSSVTVYSSDTYASGLNKVTDGWYATVNFYGDDQNEASYNFYDKTGNKFSNIQGTYDQAEEVFYAKNGARYYLDINNKLQEETNPLAKILVKGNAMPVGDYYVVEDCCEAQIFDIDGNYVNSLYIDNALGMTETTADDDYTMWTLENKIFIQYEELVHDEESTYDYIKQTEDGLQKFDLVTKVYDIEDDKIKDIDMDYVVDGAYESNGVAIAYGQEIKDGKLSANEIVQTFDTKGNVAIDFQAIVPGAEDIEHMTNEYIVLVAGDTCYVVEGKEVVAEFPDSVSFNRNAVIYSNNGNVFFYDMMGNRQEAYNNVVDYTVGFGYYLIQTEYSVVKYDTESNRSTEICSYSSLDEVSLNSMYVQVTKEYSKWNGYDYSYDYYDEFYFVDAGNTISKVSEEQGMKSITVNSLGEYYTESETEFVMTEVFSISERYINNNYSSSNTSYKLYAYETTIAYYFE